jgi:sulfite reductase (NADPH) flavoprotein alpha-component
MLGESKLKILLALIKNSSKEELLWMNGYLNGVVGTTPVAEASPAPTTATNKITIVYGTETGNSKKLATDFAAKAKKNHINAKVVGMDTYRLTDLTKEEYLLAVVSTHGEGDPPDAAKKFYDHIHQNGFKLDKLILALGDTSYPLYCKTGEDVDVQFDKLGGKRIAPLQKCDVDYEEDANSWFNNVLKALSTKPAAETNTAPASPAPAKKGKQTYEGTVLLNMDLNDKGSNKTTWHIELAADGIEYQCGDSMGIYPENPSDIVNAIIS